MDTIHRVTLSNGRVLRIVEEEDAIGINSEKDGDHDWFLVEIRRGGVTTFSVPEEATTDLVTGFKRPKKEGK
jgi:hypothetical protein